MQVCFKCRGWGHRLQDCPKRTDSTGICFKCGSTEHTSHQCQANVPDGMCMNSQSLSLSLTLTTHTLSRHVQENFHLQNVSSVERRDISPAHVPITPRVCIREVSLHAYKSSEIIVLPTGGGCKVCGSVEHLRVNCPKLKETCEGTHTLLCDVSFFLFILLAVATEGTLTRSTPTGSADADHVPSIVTKKLKPKSKTRVVKF